jgi:hypothetical protein
MGYELWIMNVEGITDDESRIKYSITPEFSIYDF